MGWQDAPLVDKPAAQPAWMSAPTVDAQQPDAPSSVPLPGYGDKRPDGSTLAAPDPANADMQARVARGKAPRTATQQAGDVIGGAVEAALNLASGIVNYPIGIASGIAGNAATALGEGAGAVATALDRKSRGVPATLPGDPHVGDASENLVTGKYMGDVTYQPKTDAGQNYTEDYVAPTMNALGPAIGHGHELAHAAPAVAPAARAVGDAVRPVAQAAGEAVAKGAGKVIGVDPELAKVAQIAGDLKHPIDVRPDQVVKGAKFTKLAGQAAADVPLSGSKTKSNQVNFTRNVIAELNPEETSERLTPETFSTAMDRSGSGVGDIMARTDVPLDAPLRDATDTLRNEVNAKETDDTAKIVNAYIDELHSKAGDDGIIDGTALRTLNSEIGRKARNNVGNDLGARLNDLQGIIEDAVQKNVDPDDATALKDFRRQYAYGKILEPTVAKTIDGVLPPSQLMGAVTRTSLGKHLMAMGKGGPMGDLAKVGQLIKEPGSSLTTERGLVYGLGLGGGAYVEPHTAAAAYGGALAYNTLGPKLTRAMVGKRPKAAAPPVAEPPAPPPEPTTSPGAGGPSGGGGGGAPTGPLGDLTPDWSTSPGAGGSGPAPGAVEPTGMHRAVDEPPVTTGNRKAAKLEVPSVPGRPDLPDAMVSGGPAETAASERAGTAMHEPGAVEARRQGSAPPADEGGEGGGGGGGRPGGGGSPPRMPPSGGPSMSETTRLLADDKQPPAVRKVLQDHLKALQAEETRQAAAVAREHDALALEKVARDTTDSALQARLLKQADALRGTERIPVGKVTEGQPEIKTPKDERIPVGKVIEGEPTPPEPIPAGEATEITPEYVEADRAWRAEHKLGAEDAARARNVAKALEHDTPAVHAAVRQFEHQPRAFDREIARITDEGEARANESKLAADGGHGDAAAAEGAGAPLREGAGSAPVHGGDEGNRPVPAADAEAGRVAEPEPAAAVRAADEQRGADRAATAGRGDGAATEAAGGRAPAGEKSPGGVERRKLTGGSIFERLKDEGAAAKKRLADADITRADEAQANAKRPAEIREVQGGFEAHRDGMRVGYLKDNLERGQAEQLGENANVDMVKVDKHEQGKGTGRALYAAFNEKHGGRIMPSGKTEPSAWKLWKRNYPEKVDAFVEQEAARIRDGADPKIVAGNITDPEVRARVLKASEPEPTPPASKGNDDATAKQPSDSGAVRAAPDEPEEIFKQDAEAKAPETQVVGSAEALDNVLREKFGDKLVQGLVDQGVLKYAKNTDEQTPRRGGVFAILRRPEDGQSVATLYYDKLTADKAPGVLMHELGEHFGIVRLLGQERYNVMLNDLRKLKNTPEVREVWNHVETHYVGHLVAKNGKLVKGGIESKAEADQLAASVEGKAHKTPAGLASTEDPLFIREVAAHLVEKHPDLPFVRRLINEIRAFFYEKFGTTMGNRVDANLIRGLAASALRKASTGALPHMKTNTPPVAYRPFVAPSSRTPVGRAPMTQ